MIAYCSLIISVNTKDSLALHNLEKLENKLTSIAEPNAKFLKWLKHLTKLEEIIQQSTVLKEHEYYLMEIKEHSVHILDEKEEILISKLKNSGSNSWLKLKDLLVSTLLVDIEEKQLPLTIVRNMAFDKDQSIRKTAYEAELKSYKKIEDSLAACLNSIKGESLTVNKMRGYTSILNETLTNSRMDEETLNAMISSMVEYMPHFRKFYRKKAELLGHSNGLPFYDLFAPIGDITMTYTYEEAKDFIVENFRDYSDKLADFALKAFNENWIDAEPREGKVAGAFCYNIHPIKQSRIMSNFSGNFTDVVTLAHELGHAYHGYCLDNEAELNSNYPMPIAETASTFCETIIKNAAIKSSPKNVAYSILETEITDCGQVIVDIYSRFLFETELFKRREKYSLSSNELKEIMLNAQKEAYGESLDENYLHPYMWACKPHYYYADTHFYNFPYAFGQLFSKGLYAEYLNKGTSFLQKYDNLLSVTGKNNLVDIAKLVGVDIRSSEFWRNSLEIIKNDIDKFIELSDFRRN